MKINKVNKVNKVMKVKKVKMEFIQDAIFTFAYSHLWSATTVAP